MVMNLKITDFKRNSSGRTRIYAEYALVTPLEISLLKDLKWSTSLFSCIVDPRNCHEIMLSPHHTHTPVATSLWPLSTLLAKKQRSVCCQCEVGLKEMFLKGGSTH